MNCNNIAMFYVILVEQSDCREIAESRVSVKKNWRFSQNSRERVTSRWMLHFCVYCICTAKFIEVMRRRWWKDVILNGKYDRQTSSTQCIWTISKSTAIWLNFSDLRPLGCSVSISLSLFLALYLALSLSFYFYSLHFTFYLQTHLIHIVDIIGSKKQKLDTIHWITLIHQERLLTPRSPHTHTHTHFQLDEACSPADNHVLLIQIVLRPQSTQTFCICISFFRSSLFYCSRSLLLLLLLASLMFDGTIKCMVLPHIGIKHDSWHIQRRSKTQFHPFSRWVLCTPDDWIFRLRLTG